MSKKHIVTCTSFDNKGRVIGNGINSYTKTHPLAKHFSVLAGESPEKCRLHAELSAVLSAGDKPVYSVFVSRFDAKGTPALAKPCKSCQKMLKAFGVVLARYTSSLGVMVDKVQEQY